MEDGVDSCPRTICLICRTILIKNSVGYVHESPRRLWDALHREEIGGEIFYVEAMPLNIPDDGQSNRPSFINSDNPENEDG